MTAPTPKPDPAPRRRPSRFVPLVASGCVVFAVLSVGLVNFLPPPHNRLQYLAIGAVATLAAILTMFVGLLLSRVRPESKSKEEP